MTSESSGGDVHNRTGDVRGPSIQARDIHGNVIVNAAAWSPPPVADLPTTADADPLALGVHRSRPDDDGDPLPPYVPRDIDNRIRDRVRRAADQGGLVLVLGGSAAGKSRAALEAVRAALPDHRLLAPPRGADLRPLAGWAAPDSHERPLLWLDDLEGHIGATGLDPTLLDALTRKRTPVVATMRTQFYDAYRPADRASWGNPTGERPESEIGMRVLNMTEPLRLDRIWSRPELDRARRSADERIVDAHAHHGPYGIAEYLAAGPQLLAEWHGARDAFGEDGHVRGHALVTAAVDLARAGLGAAVALDVLEELHAHYLPANVALLRPEPFDRAMEWATRQRHGVTSLLIPGDVDHRTWRAFDYLVDAGHTEAVPDPAWETALVAATDGDQRRLVGVAAYHADRPDIAEPIWHMLADEGDRRAMSNLGILHGDRGDDTGAERWYQAAINHGSTTAMNNLAVLMYERGEYQEATRLYGTAAAEGNEEALKNLAALRERPYPSLAHGLHTYGPVEIVQASPPPATPAPSERSSRLPPRAPREAPIRPPEHGAPPPTDPEYHQDLVWGRPSHREVPISSASYQGPWSPPPDNDVFRTPSQQRWDRNAPARYDPWRRPPAGFLSRLLRRLGLRRSGGRG